jgi:hypothetical protein
MPAYIPVTKPFKAKSRTKPVDNSSARKYTFYAVFSVYREKHRPQDSNATINGLPRDKPRGIYKGYILS